jgi:ArsR family metal-binding transcriptional regulator
MKIADFNLAVHESCAEEGKFTVEGKAPGPLDLADLARKVEEFFDRAMLSEKLGVLYLIRGSVTVHLHGDGGIVVNRVASVGEAEKILTPLFNSKGKILNSANNPRISKI